MRSQPQGPRMIVEQLEALIREAPLGALDDLSRDVWKAHAEGSLTDGKAQGFAEAIHARKVRHRDAPSLASGGSGEASGKPGRVLCPTFLPNGLSGLLIRPDR